MGFQMACSRYSQWISSLLHTKHSDLKGTKFQQNWRNGLKRGSFFFFFSDKKDATRKDLHYGQDPVVCVF